MKKLLIFVIPILYIGCATIPQGTTPSAYPLIEEEGKVKTYQIVGNGEGSDSHFTLFGFIPFGRTDIDLAVKNALSPFNGDNLINVHYYINSTYLFIGSSTGITVKGDVVKYSSSEKKEISTYIPKKTKGKMDLIHKLTIGSAVEGFAFDYTLAKSISEYLSFLFSLGWKKYDYEYDYVYTDNIHGYGSFTYSETRTDKFHALPITLNLGASAKKLMNIPIDPYANLGLTYILLYKISTEDFKWNQLGFNINVGASYLITSSLGIGVDYRYIKSFIDLEAEPISFSNLNLSVFIYP